MNIQQKYVIDFYDLAKAYEEKYGESLDIEEISAFADEGGHNYYIEFNIEEAWHEYEDAVTEKERKYSQKSYNVANLLFGLNCLMDASETVLILFDW